jgi:hypothetical protein
MFFKPVDEMSLRQLFSTDYAKSQLLLSYIGPVITPTGAIDTSPDALILDMRKSPYQTKRCEFKFIPASKNDFSHNGQFQIAIIWDYGYGKEQIRKDLLEQNGCSEIIALSEIKAFSSLAEYKYETVFKGQLIDDVKKLVVKRDEHSVVAAFVLAKCSHTFVNSEKLVNYLIKRYATVREMKPQGRGNVVSAFMQTKPQLIKHLNMDNYRWNLDFDPQIASIELAKILRENFLSEPPTDEDIKGILS